MFLFQLFQVWSWSFQRNLIFNFDEVLSPDLATMIKGPEQRLPAWCVQENFGSTI